MPLKKVTGAVCESAVRATKIVFPFAGQCANLYAKVQDWKREIKDNEKKIVTKTILDTSTMVGVEGAVARYS